MTVSFLNLKTCRVSHPPSARPQRRPLGSRRRGGEGERRSMGCTQSKIENEEPVIRCKNRKVFMGDAVASRNAFAAAQAAYAVALRNTGFALSDFARCELQDFAPPLSSSAAGAAATPSSSSSATAVAVGIKPPMETLRPPPPPPPSDSSSSSSSTVPLQRASSMPAEFAIPKSNKKILGKIPADAPILEENEGERADDERSTTGSPSPGPPRPPPPQPQTHPQSPQAPSASLPRASETWDFFFGSNENMMPPTLSQPEETTRTETREVEREGGTKVKTAGPPSVRIDEETPATAAKVVNEPPPAPMKQVRRIKNSVAMDHQYVPSAGASEMKKSKSLPANFSLIQIFMELDEHFLKASESAQEVSKMLEATRLHYHSNFADNRGHIDHSAMLMRVITWNRSFKGISQAEIGNDVFDNDKLETHAAILDKMLAWEKKLYDEVKAGEIMKFEYQKKIAMLNKQKKQGVNLRALEATKSAVSHLHTRYIVDMQSMDSTISEINHLRDNQLYHKLEELVDGMATMWKTICLHHNNQLKLVKDFRSLEVQLAPRETSQQHHERTVELRNTAGHWEIQFSKLMNHQKDYIKSLNSWLNLNLAQVEHNGKEMSSPQWQHDPPIQALLREWQDQIETLPVDNAKFALSAFSGAIHAIVVVQVEELNLKLKWDDARRDHERKRHEFEEWHLKYMERTTASSNEANPESSEGAYQQDYVSKRKISVENADNKVKAAELSYRRQCKMVREKSLSSLRTHLPDLFRSMSDFANSCSEMYRRISANSKR